MRSVGLSGWVDLCIRTEEGEGARLRADGLTKCNTLSLGPGCVDYLLLYLDDMSIYISLPFDLVIIILTSPLVLIIYRLSGKRLNLNWLGNAQSQLLNETLAHVGRTRQMLRRAPSPLSNLVPL